MSTTVYRTYSVALFVGTLLLLSVLPQVARSQEEGTSPYRIEGVPGGSEVVGDFVVGPGKVDLTLKPGESRVVEMTVTNRTGEKRTFNITTEDAVGSKTTDTSIVLLGDDTGPYSIKDYISFPSASFELEHGKRARIPVTIRIPEDAEPGGLYGTALINTLAIEGADGVAEGTAPQSAVIARIGTLFFITIPGDVAKEGTIKDFSTVPKRRIYQEGPINFGVLYENTGSIHLAPYGEMRITNAFNEEVGAVAIEPWFVLPDSIRLREISWDREFLLGKYTATVRINRSYGDIVDESSFTFWVLPWKIMLATFALLFVIFFIIRAFFRNFEFKRKR